MFGTAVSAVHRRCTFGRRTLRSSSNALSSTVAFVAPPNQRASVHESLIAHFDTHRVQSLNLSGSSHLITITLTLTLASFFTRRVLVSGVARISLGG